MDLIKALNKEQLEKEVPQVQVGDTVRVHVKVKEGARERIQVFEGTVIAKNMAALRRPSPSVVSPTAWAWKRCSPVHSPPSPPSKWSATASCAAPSCTICVTALVKAAKVKGEAVSRIPRKERTPQTAGVFFAKEPGL